MNSYPGIDYSGPVSKVNRDPENGIRYGVISTNSLTEYFWDSVENDYGDPTCPKCGEPALDSGHDDIPASEDREDWEYHGNDFACIDCKYTFWSDQAYPDEALGWHINDGTYQVIGCLDNDAMVIKSPYYTMAQFCSPCVPGAGNLDNACAAGIPSYCFGHDWFDGGVAPYPVYLVSTGNQIIAERHDVLCQNCQGRGHDTVERLARVRQDTPANICYLINDGQIRVTGFDGAARFDCFRCAGKGTEFKIIEREVQA